MGPGAGIELAEVVETQPGVPAVLAQVGADHSFGLRRGAFDEEALAAIEVDVFLPDQSRRGVDALDFRLVQVERGQGGELAPANRAYFGEADVDAASLRVDG